MACAVQLRSAIRVLEGDDVDRRLPTVTDTSDHLLLDLRRMADEIRVRMDTKFWMDDRDSTMLRRPNPELQFWLAYEAKL